MNWLHLLKRPLDIPRATRPFFRDYPLRVTAHIANSRCVISDPMRFLYFRIPKAVNSTIIGKVESLSEDLPVIVERIFGNHEFAIEQRASHATGASSKRKTMLNHNQMLRIHRIYEQDFDLLHYPAEL